MSDSLNHIDVYVLDMDGTIYLGDHVISGAIDFTRRARAGRQANTLFHEQRLSK